MVAAITTAIALRRSRSPNSTETVPSTIGRMTAPPSPRTARAAMNAPGDVAYAAASELDPEDDQGRDQHLLAAEAVAEHAAGDHRGREDERVRGDEPLQLRRSRRAGRWPARAAPG